MFKHWFMITSLIVVFVALPGLALAAASPADLAPAHATLTAGLTETDVESLLFMREEEKLAHDVYVTLYSTWRLPIFTNIARSETTHMNAVKLLLDRYGLADPAEGNPVGVFSDPALQTLYDELVATGRTSLAQALGVGVQIEELDIADLQTRLTQTSQADIKTTYANLLRGSQNHLRAFTRQLQ